MTFWAATSSRHPALYDERAALALSYEELQRALQMLAELLGKRTTKRLGFVLCNNSAGTLVAYLAALQIGDAVCLTATTLSPSGLSQLLTAYQPDWIVSPLDQRAEALSIDYERLEGPHGTAVFKRRLGAESEAIHPELALMLPTSGTTGSPKMVRLSYRALQSNAAAIAEYLALSSAERPILALPMHYSYGLSVVNSHLLAGATVLLSSSSVTSRAFWDLAAAKSATSLAGVPYTYEMLFRTGLRTLAPSSLKTATVAGGRLRANLVKHFADELRERAGRFFVMYGQTEATARISYVSPDRLYDKLGSIGVPIPGGALELSESGELVYRGANVMLGYAECRADLTLGDDLHGVLATGDLGTKDAEGYYYVTGRIKRFSKILGLRISLDDVELLLAGELSCGAACAASDEQLSIVLDDEKQVTRARELVAATYRLHPSVIRVSSTAELPRTANGKTDYAALTAMVAQ
jgi:acyl-CoA synthetase (AMP-forming)/AMP-acid ligase II